MYKEIHMAVAFHIVIWIFLFAENIVMIEKRECGQRREGETMLQKDAIGFEEFVKLADQSYNEIFIRNKDGKIVYANTACY